MERAYAVAFRKGALQVPRLRSPGFPAELGGVGEPHVAFLTESHTRSYGWGHVQEIRVGMTRVGWCFQEELASG
jgi:hypothetical protein